MPIHCRMVKTLQQYGPIILHVCGNVADRFPMFIKAGFKGFHMDSRNDIPKAVAMAKNNIKIVGCINNPVTLSQGTQEEVRREVEYNLACGIKMIAPECAVPTNVPTANLKELVRTAHSYNLDTVKNLKDFTKSVKNKITL
jgi:uroporphyrinogen-III decarboxylase